MTTSATRFAELEQRTALTAFRLLRNCNAVLNGVAVDGIFSNDYLRGDVGVSGMGTTMPALALPAVQVPADPEGLPVTVDGVPFTVVQVRTNGADEAHLLLEVAS